MPDYDDMLQKKLSDLENGADLDEVLQDLPEEAKEIGIFNSPGFDRTHHAASRTGGPDQPGADPTAGRRG